MKKFLVFVLALLLMMSSCVAETADNLTLAEGADIRIMSYNLMNPDWSKVAVTDRVPNVVNILCAAVRLGP